MSAECLERRLRAAIPHAMLLKWQIFSGAIRTAIRCPLPRVSTGKRIIILDVFVVRRGKAWGCLQTRDS